MEVAVVPLGWVGRPCALDAAGHGVAANATALFVQPAKTLGFQVLAFRTGAKVGCTAISVGFANGVATGRQCNGLLVVHGHAGKGQAHVVCRALWVGLAHHAFRVHVNQTHLNGCKWVVQRLPVLTSTVIALGGEPLLLGTPVDVLLWVPNVLAAKAKAVGLQAGGLVGHISSEDEEVGPGELVAVFLLDGPQQTTAFVEVAVVGPGVQGGEALGTSACAATAVSDPVGAGCVPGQANHEAAVMAPIGRPPLLAVGHECGEVFLHCRHVQFLHFLAVVEALERVGLGVLLVQDVQVEGGGPPLHVRDRAGGVSTVHDRALAQIRVACVHGVLLWGL